MIYIQTSTWYHRSTELLIIIIMFTVQGSTNSTKYKVKNSVKVTEQRTVYKVQSTRYRVEGTR